MINLEILFTDLFGDEKITTQRLGTFTFDHLARVEANNPGSVFNTIITNTHTALDALGDVFEEKGSNIGEQKGATSTKKLTRKAFTEYMRQQEGTIRGKFGVTSEPYIQFFPDGLTAFNRATDIGYTLLVNNIIARATQYEADLGVTFKDAVIALGTAYKNAEENQTTEKGEVSASRDGVFAERNDLTRQLTINALTIALQFPLQPEKAHIYFNTSLLFAQHRKHIYKGEPAAGSTTLVTEIEYEAGKFVKMINKGAAKLTFQMYLLGTAVGNSYAVEPGEEVEHPMSAFFSNADELKVTNTGTVTGQYVVKLIA